MLSQDESTAFWEWNNGDQCIFSCQERPMCVCEGVCVRVCVCAYFDVQIFEGESLTF